MAKKIIVVKHRNKARLNIVMPEKKIPVTDLISKTAEERHNNMHQMFFENIHFTSHAFHKVNFKDSRFENCTFTNFDFNNCDLSHTGWNNCTFTNCEFNDCDMIYSHIQYGTMSDCSFQDANMGCAEFEEMAISNTTFHRVLLGQAEFNSCAMDKNTQLTSCIFDEIQINTSTWAGLQIDHIMTIGPLGSRNTQLTILFTNRCMVLMTGCFTGTLGDFQKASEVRHGTQRVCAVTYKLTIDYAKKIYRAMFNRQVPNKINSIVQL